MAQTLIRVGEVINGGIYRAAPLNARFDAQLISPHILGAEERYIVPLLCRPMYEDMIASMFAGNSNYNPDAGALQAKFPNDTNYEDLWSDGGLLELIGHCVYAVTLPYIVNQTGSNGLYNNNTEFGTNSKDLKLMIDTTNQTILALTDRVMNYLCKNQADYDLFPASEKCVNYSGCETNCIDQEQVYKGEKLHRFGIF